MKNIPLQHFLTAAIEARYQWPTLQQTTVYSRLKAKQHSSNIDITRYVGDKHKAYGTVSMWLKDHGYIVFEAANGKEIYAIRTSDDDEYIGSLVTFQVTDSTGILEGVGDYEELLLLKNWFKEIYQETGSHITTVEDIDANGRLIKTSTFVPTHKVQAAHQSFYPWLTIPLEEYFDAFMKSDENILVLFGPPGTGKSTFLRSFIAYQNNGAWLAYNRKVVEAPQTVNSFFRSSAKILAYEDIDNHLGSRENGNMLMSTLLNASEGILQHPGKKIVFSTNLPSIDRIDAALLRVGRCFDIIKFELLTQDEATTARAAVGLEPRDFSAKHSWALSEVLVKESSSQQAVNRYGRKVGF